MLFQKNGIKNIHFKFAIIDFLAIENQDTGKLEGIKLKIYPKDENMIYHKTDGSPVGFFPTDLSISLDMKSIVNLNAIMLDTLSSYLFNLRQAYAERNYVSEIISKLDQNRFLKVRASRHFFRQEEIGRYKISMAFFKFGKEGLPNTETLNINFTKRDVLLFSSILRRITSSYFRDNGISIYSQLINAETDEFVKEKNIIAAKVDNSIVLDQVWLHGQELMNLMFIIHELLFKLNIEERLDSLNSFYRQIKFYNENKCMYMELTKMNKDHMQIFYEEDGVQLKHVIPLTAYTISALYLFLNINILRHADFEIDENTDVLGSSRTNLGEGSKFHISTKESLLGISIKERKHNPDESKISLVGKVKEGAFFEINDLGDRVENVIKHYDSSDKLHLIPALDSFNIDLKDQWPKLIKGLAIAYTEEYKDKEREFNQLKFFVLNKESDGCRYKYQFSIYADKNNKAPAVLMIDKILFKNKEEEIIARFRQPLFKKYIYQLMTIILACAQDVENLDLTEEHNGKELLSYQYKSFKNVREVKSNKSIVYGLKKNPESVIFGNFSGVGTTSELSIQDAEFLNISSEYRIFNKEWIPFVGDMISIGQDNYITDMYGEFPMNEDYKSLEWAIKFFFGTTK